MVSPLMPAMRPDMMMRTAVRRGKTLGQRILDNWQLYLLILIPVLLTVI